MQRAHPHRCHIAQLSAHTGRFAASAVSPHPAPPPPPTRPLGTCIPPVCLVCRLLACLLACRHRCASCTRTASPLALTTSPPASNGPHNVHPQNAMTHHHHQQQQRQRHHPHPRAFMRIHALHPNQPTNQPPASERGAAIRVLIHPSADRSIDEAIVRSAGRRAMRNPPATTRDTHTRRRRSPHHKPARHVFFFFDSSSLP